MSGEKHEVFGKDGKVLNNLSEFLKEFNNESDRGAVLIAAATLEDVLAQCIRNFVVLHKDVDRLLVGFGAPLGSLAAKSLVAFALGLVSEDEYEELKILRKIRNHFAHTVREGFAAQSIQDLAKRLRPSYNDNDARHKYLFSSTVLIIQITNRLYETTQQRRTIRQSLR